LSNSEVRALENELAYRHGRRIGLDAAIVSPAQHHEERAAHHTEMMQKHQGASMQAALRDDLAGASSAHEKAAKAHQVAALSHGTAKQHAVQMSPGYNEAATAARAEGLKADSMTKAMLDQRQGADGEFGWDDGEQKRDEKGQFSATTTHSEAGSKTQQQAEHHEAMHGTGFKESPPSAYNKKRGQDRTFQRTYGLHHQGFKPKNADATSEHVKVEPSGEWSHEQWGTWDKPGSSRQLGKGQGAQSFLEHLAKHRAG